jgi:hypothetical protein
MRPALALIALLLPAACAAPQDGSRGGIPGGRTAAGVPTLEAAAARLPASVADFTRGSTTWLERERPGQGVAVDFAGPSRAAVATVSLYDRGEQGLGMQANDPRLAREFSSAVADVVALAGTRTSQQLAERERSELPVPGGAPLSCSRLDGTYGRQEMRTLVCLGTASGRFLKVQVTSPVRQVRPVDPLPFVVQVAQAARGA